MNIRLATKNDIQHIMEIIHYAQRYLASLNIDQWQDGYPDEAQITNDINNKESYVVLDNEAIISTFMFSTGGESTYKVIDGNWLTDNQTNYGVIHRIAVSEKNTNKGIAKYIMSHCEEQLTSQGIHSMRIDTHPDNKGMQHILTTLGYTYCGIITLERGGIRLAFEKRL